MDQPISPDALPDNAPPTLNFRKLVLQTVVGLLVLLGLITLLGFFWKDPILEHSKSFVERFGGPGISVGLFLPDAFSVPLPHEAFMTFGLLGGLGFWEVVAWASLGSLSGGCLAFLCGKWFGTTALFKKLARGHTDRARRLLTRYGMTTLGIAALTPLPYSITCWTCGALEMRFVPFFLVSLLRVPRIIFYLWLIELGFLHAVG